MILFEQDYAKYPRVILDTKTTNQSFVRLATVYRAMGIKNNAFMLALHNPDLQGLDPFDPNLSVHEMALVAVEAFENPWYYLREIARAPGMAGSDAVPVEGNRGNIALFWSFFNHIMTFLIQIRQTGKSFSTDTLMSYLMNIKCRDTQINLLTKDDDLRRKNIIRIKDIMSELPRYLQQRSKDDANNTEEVTIKNMGNSYSTHVPQASPKRAYNMGRGLTSPIFHIDEPPFQPNISIALPAALAAGGAAIDRAKAAGAPYGTILTTTAGKKDDKDGKYVYNLLSDSAVWTERFFDAKNFQELEQMVRRNSRSGKFMVNITLNHKQLGKNDEWLKQKLEENLQTGDDANRDFFNLWTSGSQTHPLPLSTLEAITGSVTQPLHVSVSNPHGYVIRWYIPENEIAEYMATHKVVLGMDTSDASGGDDISLVMMDIETLDIIGIGTYNETNLIVFSEWVCSLLVTYKNLTAIIERRSTGSSLLDYLLLMLPQKGEDPFRRLFNRVVHDYDESRDRFAEINQPIGRRPQDVYIRYKKTFGFATSGAGVTSRTELYSGNLQNAAKRGGTRTRDKSLIDQIAGLVTRNGRIDHEVGEHDDLVIGWLLCFWLMTQGKNLSFYGIDPKRIMSLAGSKITESPEEALLKYEQQMIRDKIEEIYEQLTNTNDEFISKKLEHELSRLDKQLILEEGEIYSMDALIQQAREAKAQRRRMQVQNYGNDNRFGYQNAPVHRTDGVLSDRPLSASEYFQRF